MIILCVQSQKKNKNDTSKYCCFAGIKSRSQTVIEFQIENYHYSQNYINNIQVFKTSVVLKAGLSFASLPGLYDNQS